ncbi:MAG: glycosyltransferase family 4 protein [Chloroflexota bacterium]|nr:MAG: hypothetical protein DLM70_14300 [Chloroflexota bacterium]
MTRILSIALMTLGDPGRLTGGYLYHRRMANLAEIHNARIEFVSFPDRPFLLPALNARNVLRRARRSGARVIVLDSIAAGFLGPKLLLSSPDVPVVAILHQPPGGIDHGRMRTSIQTGLDRLAYARCRRLIVASESLAHELAAQGVSRERIDVVPPGRDMIGDTQRPAGDLRQGRRAAFLCVGNWVERKGIHSLLDAFARIPEAMGTLHLVGDDQVDSRYAALLHARIGQLDLVDRVVVHGPLPSEQVAGLYRAADVFVLPSLREPYGTVYGEAMAAGLPVVGWHTGNLPYLAEDGREGLLITPGDAPGLGTALELLARDEAWRRRLGEAASRRAQERPTWAESAVLFFAAIRRALEEH